MYCRMCGAEIPDDSVYCLKCGCKTNYDQPKKEIYVDEPEHEIDVKLKIQKFDEELNRTANRSVYIVIAVITLFIIVLAIVPSREENNYHSANSKATSSKENSITVTTKNDKTENKQELPKSGTIFHGKDIARTSELTIKSSSNNSCYIKMKNQYGTTVFSFFVRAGESITMKVPAGMYQVFFAYGDDWYGTSLYFGEDTVYAKDKDLLDFENYTWEYTLYPVTNGNFQETTISKNEF